MSAVETDCGRAFAADCARSGLDLSAPFPVSAFNATAAAAERLPDFGRADALAVLVGNTRRLWPAFRAAISAHPARLQARHPLDDYVVESVVRAALATGTRHELRWAHTMRPVPIPIQRIAERAGLAVISPSQLSAHPEFGPWIALRAVAIFDITAPASLTPRVTGPCAACAAKPCVPPFERALRAATTETRTTLTGMGEDWRRWLEVRDACPVGTAHRYSDHQIEYHYTKTRSLLSYFATVNQK